MTTLVGITLGLGCILLGFWLEGGELASVSQLTAFLIVIGGTLGAVITQFPLEDLRRACAQVGRTARRRRDPPEPLIQSIVELARKSRRDGLLALDNETARINDPFLRDAVQALVDGHEPGALRSLLETSIEQDEVFQEPGPRCFEAAGGYAPTIGILGAVLGLIQVMENLADPERLGAGIAVAFVATVYGVGSANLIFLPIAGKMKLSIESESQRKEMIMEGICAIREGVNPQMIQRRLLCFIGAEPGSAAKAGAKGRPVAQRRRR